MSNDYENPAKKNAEGGGAENPAKKEKGGEGSSSDNPLKSYGNSPSKSSVVTGK